jgi:hypothetical protein
LEEAGLFAYKDNGSTGAPDGYYDDLVISRSIVAYLLSQPRQNRTPGMLSLGFDPFDPQEEDEERPDDPYRVLWRPQHSL